MQIKKIPIRKGIALLTAVLVVSVILAIVLTLMSFIIKQFQISSSSQQSVLAIYAADAGMECALLWDIRGTEPLPDFYGDYVFATSTGNGAPANSGLNCFNTDITSAGASYTIVDSDANSATTEFTLDIAPTGCTVVSIEKDDSGPNLTTSVLSRGYNVPCAERGNIRAVERAVRVDYQFI